MCRRLAMETKSVRYGISFDEQNINVKQKRRREYVDYLAHRKNVVYCRESCTYFIIMLSKIWHHIINSYRISMFNELVVLDCFLIIYSIIDYY